MKKVNDIFQTQCPTFPRSGHRILRQVLGEYFGDRLNWCDIHQCPERGFARNPDCNMEKNHDFDLKLAKAIDRIHLVGIRNPIHAIAGWQAMKIREKTKTKDWFRWHLDALKYWHEFTKKWLYTPVPHRLVVPYEDLVHAPLYAFDRIINAMDATAKGEINMGRLMAILGKMDIKPREVHPRPFSHV